jgi:hypothetical protein
MYESMICEDKIRSAMAIRIRASPTLLLLLLIGCSYTPTPPSALPSSGSQVLRGTVYPDGTTTVWAESPHEGVLSVTVSEEMPAGVPIGVAVGGPTGSSGHCETGDPVAMAIGSTPQEVPAIAAGLYCLNVSDTGSVKSRSGVSFSLTVRFR